MKPWLRENLEIASYVLGMVAVMAGFACWELQTFYFANYIIFPVSLGCIWFFVRGILALRRDIAPDWALPDSMVYLISYAILFLSSTICTHYRFMPYRIPMHVLLYEI